MTDTPPIEVPTRDPSGDPVDGSGNSSPPASVPDAEAFRQEQVRKAAEQNVVAPNAVPETRPQAFTQPVGSQSATSQAVAEAGLDGSVPHGLDEHQAAASDANAQAAADQSRTPTIREGERVVITQDGPYNGHNAFVVEVKYADHNAEVVRGLGNNESRFAEVDSVIVRTRDGRSDTIELSADEVDIVPAGDWGRSAI